MVYIFKKGDRVKNTLKQEWGIGEILDVGNGKARIFFVGDGLKILNLEYAKLNILSGDESKHPILDNLVVIGDNDNFRYQSLHNSKNVFIEKMPNGFYGEKFLDEERNYKVEAHKLSRILLEKNVLYEMLQTKDYAEINKRVLKLVNKTNLIFPQEKMALKDGLLNEELHEKFSHNLYNLLYGKETIRDKFESFIFILGEMDALKWPTITYFLFIHFPEKHMFVKPTITKNAAELCGWNIYYEPKPNWKTYKAVLGLSEYLFKELGDLNPRDMIDVQSFLWCIEPGKK